jgi:hypothetical protein
MTHITEKCIPIFNGIFVKHKNLDPQKWAKYYPFCCYFNPDNQNNRHTIVDIFGISTVQNLLITPDNISFKKIYKEEKKDHTTRTIVTCNTQRVNLSSYPDNFYAGTWSLQTGQKKIKENIIIYKDTSKTSIFELPLIDHLGKDHLNPDFLASSIPLSQKRRIQL